MLVDTHCHINMIVKKEFDAPLTSHQVTLAKEIVDQSIEWGVTTLINVGTSLIESQNCITLAETYDPIYATIGIHPNDCTDLWKKDFCELTKYIKHPKVVGVGECGLDMHYEGYNLTVQKDALKAQIELALENNKALVIHSRDAYDETLLLLDEFHNDIKRAVMHCFSYDLQFAQQVIEWGFKIGIDGPITYPKNNELRHVVTNVKLEDIVLETDAPFLPVQQMRGKKNEPKYIKTIAEYMASLRNEDFEKVARVTTHNAKTLFGIQ